MKAGIVSYGAYVPRFRIKPHEIAAVWGQDGEAMSRGLGVKSKSVPGPDEDVITIAVEAARIALNRAQIDPADIGAVYVGSESHPYAVKPSATIVAEAIGATPNLTAADYEFACKAGTAAIQTSLGLVGSESIRYGVAIGADTSQGAPGDALEYTASAGGAAYIIGTENVIATIERTCSYTTDTPDFWRREGEKYPSHGGRFTGEPAYFKHVLTCATNLMEITGTKSEDFNYAVFHQPNGKFPVSVAKKLGFSMEQIADGLLTPIIGNTYSGAVLIGLASILEKAKNDERILMVSYGSGAGSDAFDIRVTDAIESLERTGAESLKSIIENHTFISYATYAKYMGKIHLRGA